MNIQLSTMCFDGYLRLIGRALTLCRVACQAGDNERAEAIVDAIHNLPRFLIGEEFAGFKANYVLMFLEPLIDKYPDLSELRDYIL